MNHKQYYLRPTAPSIQNQILQKVLKTKVARPDQLRDMLPVDREVLEQNWTWFVYRVGNPKKGLLYNPRAILAKDFDSLVDFLKRVAPGPFKIYTLELEYIKE